MSSPVSGSGALSDSAEDFRALFFEEADEHVAAMESTLLQISLVAPQAEELNAIFRAAHSIKGSSAMLGFAEISSMTHVLENLLDDLRKGERTLTEQILDLMLRAGDMVRMQVAFRRGTLAQAPDASSLETELRVLGESKGAPATQRFAVRLGPLAEPVASGELELMLSGLAEMGKVRTGEMRNSAGGEILFEVELEAGEADLRSVLTLVVPSEAVHIDKLGQPPPPPPPASAAPKPSDDGSELFIDPAQWKKRQKAKPEAPGAPDAAAVAEAPPASGISPAAKVASASEAQPEFESFVDPQQMRAQRDKARSPGRRATDDPIALPSEAGRRATDRPVAGAVADTGSIRVGIDKVDRLVNLVGELVITEAMLTQQQGRDGSDTQLAAGLADLTRYARNLQEAVMSIRMVPISSVFTRFPRLVRELSQRFGKEVELKVSGESTELDRGLVEKVIDPLTHLVRNSIDHGIETPQARLALGKPRAGTITLSAAQKGGNIVITVRDDGAGLNRDKILAHAAKRGIAISPDASDGEVWQLIFQAGFSTAEVVTDVSGRGVGMDVVRRNIQVLGGGTVDLSSSEGAGTTVTVSVPLTLAIMEGMSVAVGTETYVLPLSAVIESRSIAPGEIVGIAGQGHTLRVRDEFLPVVRLSGLFPARDGAAPGAGEIAVVVEAEGAKAALLVDELLGQQQIVVKSLETNFRRVPGISSATIMGDGRVALILDLSYVVLQSSRRARARELLA